MREIARIVSGLVALRIVEENEINSCERFESGKWIGLSVSRMQELLSNPDLKRWLEENRQIAKVNVVRLTKAKRKTKKKIVHGASEN